MKGCFGMYNYFHSTGYRISFISILAIGIYSYFKVRYIFKKYSKVSAKLSGSEVARRILDYNEVQDIEVAPNEGYSTNYFDSRSKKICLLEDVYNKYTIASVCIAAHESAHAIQKDQSYILRKLRCIFAPIMLVVSNVAFPIIIGVSIPSWDFAVKLGIIFIAMVIMFQLITLPVEFDANRRALNSLLETGILDESEIQSAKEVLTGIVLLACLSSVFPTSSTKEI